jgi:RNA polymerase sigma-70 factor (ECF subfamily)
LAAIVPHQMRVVRRVLGPHRADAEDVTYEAAYAVVDGLARFSGESTVLYFACRVAVLLAMKVRRSEATQKRKRAEAELDAVQEPFAEGLDPEQAILQASLAPIVRELFGTLSAPHAEALALHVVLGYTVSEIAVLAEVPEETVRSRLRLAKQALRKRVMNHPALREVVGGEP